MSVGRRRQPGCGIRNARVVLKGDQQTTILSFRSDNLLTSVLCVWNAVWVWRDRWVGEVYRFFSFCRNQQVQTASYNQAGTVLNLRTPLNWDEECEVRANAIARADWVILHSVITLITILPPLSLYLDWSLLSGTRLHPRGFICDSLSSPTLPISSPRLLFPFSFLSLHLSRSSSSHLSVALSYLSFSISCNRAGIIFRKQIV